MDTAAVVWLSQDPAQAAPESRRALEEWARARGLKLYAAPREAAASLPIDHELADRVEQDLARARESLAALDRDGAEKALARAESLVRAHPELPQAGWLLAEILRAWSARWARIEPRDPDKAASTWRDAAVLDGGRAAGLGEEARAGDPAQVEGALEVDGGAEGVELRIDGVLATAGKVRAAAGEHHLRAARDGATLWAGFVKWDAGASVRVPLPRSGACSEGELRRARVEEDVVHASGVRCARWAAVVATDRPEVIRVAVCDGASCGPLLEWRARNAFAQAPPVTYPREKTGGFPAWGWALAGVSAIAITGVVLASAGAFDQARAPEVRLVNGGVRVESH